MNTTWFDKVTFDKLLQFYRALVTTKLADKFCYPIYLAHGSTGHRAKNNFIKRDNYDYAQNY